MKASELLRDAGEPFEVGAPAGDVDLSALLPRWHPALEVEVARLAVFMSYAEQEAQARENLLRMIVVSGYRPPDPFLMFSRRASGTEE